MLITEIPFSSIMNDIDAYINKKIKDMAEQCPWMTNEELDEYTAILYDNLDI